MTWVWVGRCYRCPAGKYQNQVGKEPKSLSFRDRYPYPIPFLQRRRTARRAQLVNTTLGPGTLTVRLALPDDGSLRADKQAVTQQGMSPLPFVISRRQPIGKLLEMVSTFQAVVGPTARSAKLASTSLFVCFHAAAGLLALPFRFSSSSTATTCTCKLYVVLCSRMRL